MSVFKTRAQAVTDDVRKRILKGEFTGGEQLRQDALAKEYQVSRIPVREALLALEAEGLVEFHAHRGAFVTELSIPRIKEIFALRALLECHIFRLSIPHISESAIQQAEVVLTHYNSALEGGDDISRWSDYNLEFHRLLYSGAQQPETEAIIAQLNQQANRYIRMQLLYSQKISKAEKEHRKLLKRVKQGRVDDACQLLKKHIEDACDSIVSVLSQLPSKEE